MIAGLLGRVSQSLLMDTTSVARAEDVHGFVQSRSEQNLMKRGPDYFRDAASEGRLIHAEWKPGAGVVGAVSFSPEDLGSSVEFELTGLIVGPDARGFGLGGMLARLATIYHHAQEYDRDRSYIAHVVDGNDAPVSALTQAGFREVSVIHVPKGAAGGALDHLALPGNGYIIGHRYEFDESALDRLIIEIDDFIKAGSHLNNYATGEMLALAFGNGLVNVEAISAHADYVRGRESA
jgi:GNAT superfamily N-acetyltransferase